MKTCMYFVFDENDPEEKELHECGKPARMCLKLLSGTFFWLCADHYDTVTKFWRNKVKYPTHSTDEELYEKVLRMNREPVYDAG
jgi:hypothetical protein